MKNFYLLKDLNYLEIKQCNEDYIYANWKGYVTVFQVKEGCQAILEHMTNTGIHKLINDNRELKGTWTQAIRWLDNVFMPQFINIGLEKIAFIYSNDNSARYSLDRFLEVNDQYVAQTFENLRLAENWILGKNENNSSSRISEMNISVRQGETHHIININKVLYISCLEGKTVIHTSDQNIEVNLSLKDVLKKFPKNRVEQVHKSYAININQISSIKYYAGGSYHAYLHSLSKVKIPVGRKYTKQLKVRLGI